MITHLSSSVQRRVPRIIIFHLDLVRSFQKKRCALSASSKLWPQQDLKHGDEPRLSFIGTVKFGKERQVGSDPKKAPPCCRNQVNSGLQVRGKTLKKIPNVRGGVQQSGRLPSAGRLLIQFKPFLYKVTSRIHRLSRFVIRKEVLHLSDHIQALPASVHPFHISMLSLRRFFHGLFRLAHPQRIIC